MNRRRSSSSTWLFKKSKLSNNSSAGVRIFKIFNLTSNKLPTVSGDFPESDCLNLVAKRVLKCVPLNSLQSILEAKIRISSNNELAINCINVDLPPKFGPLTSRWPVGSSVDSCSLVFKELTKLLHNSCWKLNAQISLVWAKFSGIGRFDSLSVRTLKALV